MVLDPILQLLASPVKLVALVLVFVAVLIIRSSRNDTAAKLGLQLPPRVPGLFLIGNLVDVLRATKLGEQHLLFEKWARLYGPIYKVRVGPFTQYFVNTDEAVKMVFDKAAAQTAERPRWIVSNEQICNKWNVLLLNGSDARWKHQRKVIHSGMTSIPRADGGLPFMHYETARFLSDVVNDQTIQTSSRDLWRSLSRYTYSTFTSQTFGLDVPDSRSPLIPYIHETGLAQILGTLPGYYIVDLLPFLDRLPLFLKPWERAGRARFQRDRVWCNERLAKVKAMEDRSAISEAFLCRVLDSPDLLGFGDEEEAAYLSLMLTIGAADTSLVSTWAFLEAMINYPDVQKKGREEIEKVVGDRLPVYEDIEQIPYVRCLVKETWRWRPPVALGHPHLTTRDLTLDGLLLPKGSRIHLNSWAIQHDPDRHDDPERFWPERYTDDLTTTMQSINSSDVKKRDHFAFGSGRRVCPGYNVAERSLTIAIMRLLWSFDIQPSQNAKMPLDPADYRGPMPGMPGQDMPITLRPLSSKKVEIINRAFSDLESTRTKLQPL